MKSLFTLTKEGALNPVAIQNSVTKYEFSQQIACEKCNLIQTDQLSLNKHFNTLAVEIASQTLDNSDFPAFCPSVTNSVISFRGLNELHPNQKKRDIQGATEIIYRTQEFVKQLSGLFGATVVTTAGLNAKYTALKMVSDYFTKNNQTKNRVVLVTLSDETPVVSQELFGYEIVQVQFGSDLKTNINAFESAIDSYTACAIIPDMFFSGINAECATLCEIAHKNGAFVYCESTNFSKVAGIIRPSDLGVDIFELKASDFNVACAKDFAPLAVCERLDEFLPRPLAVKDRSGSYSLINGEKDSWQLKKYYGSLTSCASFYAYVLAVGGDGFKNASEMKAFNKAYLNKAISQNKLTALKQKNFNPSECETTDSINEFISSKK